MTDISIIIPVLDEQSRINACIEHVTRQQTNLSIEIIVVDGDPTGSTLNVITQPQVIKLQSPKGRAKQMNVGAAQARGSALLFLHADTQLPPTGLLDVLRTLEKYPAGAFDVTFGRRFYFQLVTHIVFWRSHLTRIPYGDQAIFLRSSYFEALGGYADIPIMEDVELMRRIKKRGDHIGFVRNRAETSPRRWQNEGFIFTTTRNIILSTLFYLGLPAEKLVNYYKSGKRVYRKHEKQ